jgi:hypothetical protein
MWIMGFTMDMSQQGVYENSLYSAQFWYESKISLKIQFIGAKIKKLTDIYEILLRMGFEG